MGRSSLLSEEKVESVTGVIVQVPGVQEGQESGVVGVPWRKWLRSNPGDFYRTRDTSLYFLCIATEKSEIMRELSQFVPEFPMKANRCLSLKGL